MRDALSFHVPFQGFVLLPVVGDGRADRAFGNGCLLPCGMLPTLLPIRPRSVAVVRSFGCLFDVWLLTLSVSSTIRAEKDHQVQPLPQLPQLSICVAARVRLWIKFQHVDLWSETWGTHY